MEDDKNKGECEDYFPKDEFNESNKSSDEFNSEQDDDDEERKRS